MSKPLTKRDADWLRSFAAAMWEARQDDIDAEEFANDRNELNRIADKIEASLVPPVKTPDAP
jgi:hypothetical protein